MQIHEEEYRHHIIRISQDDDIVDSPRNWDNLGTMICFHSRYNLGDEHPWTVDEAKEIAGSKDYISLPLYLYDHSGISMSTRSFVGRAHHAEWDSGQVGFIWVAKEDVLSEFNRKKMSNKLEHHVLRILKSEVEIYDQYLRGDVYCFSIEKNEDIFDSCCGFYGFDYCLEEAKDIIKHATKEQEGLIY